MNKFFLIAILFCLQLQGFAKVSLATDLFMQKTDTIIAPANIEEDNAINEVLKSRAVPKPEKVQYISQVTRYGFKNLFKNYSYNPSMPYTSQVNPHAENYMQDYMISHGNYLQKRRAMMNLILMMILKISVYLMMTQAE